MEIRFARPPKGLHAFTGENRLLKIPVLNVPKPPREKRPSDNDSFSSSAVSV